MKTSEWKEYYKTKYPEIWEKEVLGYGFTEYHSTVLKLLRIQKNEHVLECGIGTGWPIALELPRSGADIMGVDIAKRILEECKLNFKKENLSVKCCQGDIEELPFRDNCFDKVYSISTTWYLTDIRQSLSEMFRVTKRGGILIFDILNLFHISWFVGHFYNIFRNSAIIQKIKPSRTLHKYRTPFFISKILRELGIGYIVRGYFIFLPVSMPLLCDKADLCRYSKMLSYGLSESCLKYFGSIFTYFLQSSPA